MTFADYDRYDGLGQAALVQRGEVRPEELLEEAILRAERVNPRLNAIVEPMFDLARARLREGLPGGPFRGVPFLLKDLGSAFAGVPLRNGCRYFRDNVPGHDAEIVARFKRAGLSIFGKTNTPEFGILPVTEPELFGPTQNPWRPGHTPGGSSGGSAAAVAAGIVPMAHGGDGGGSLRIPGACCALFAMKPSRGRQPVGPDQSEMFFGYAIEHVLTRSVRDSAAMLDATAGAEPTSLFHAPPSEGPFLEALARPLGRLRIAFTAEPLLPAKVHPDCRQAVEDAARLCESLGHEVVEARPHVDAHTFARDFFLSFCAATAAEIARIGRACGRPVRSTDVEASTWLLGMIGKTIDAGAFVESRVRLQEAGRGVLRFFERHDVLLTPTLGLPPVPIGALSPKGLEARLHEFVAKNSLRWVLSMKGLIDMAVDRAYAFAPFTPVFNVTGQPSMNVPLCWNAEGLPIGTMFTGRFGDEARLFQLAAELEQARPWKDRRPPVWAGR
jgi:amidase